jgi:hypothetical protein
MLLEDVGHLFHEEERVFKEGGITELYKYLTIGCSASIAKQCDIVVRVGEFGVNDVEIYLGDTLTWLRSVSGFRKLKNGKFEPIVRWYRVTF